MTHLRVIALFSMVWGTAYALPFPSGFTLPKSPLTHSERVVHALGRLSFGPRPGQVARLTEGGERALHEWIEGQLFPKTIDDSIVEKRLAEIPFWTMGIGELQAKYPNLGQVAKRMNLPDQDESTRKRLKEMVGKEHLPEAVIFGMASAKLIRSVESERQLNEVLADFWFNHFNVDASKGKVKWYLPNYENEVIRPRIFGRFRDLLGAVAKSPAMLFYLDNAASVKEGFKPKGKKRKDQVDAPRGLNENYARELLELHTLGVDGGYEQKDVRELARALTGWSIDTPNEGAHFIFRAPAHDTDEKQVLGLQLPSGGGIEEGERLLDRLAQHPSTAKFIATKLARRFVADKPPASLIDKLAKTFLQTDGDLRTVYLTLFSSEEFWSKEAFRAKVKTPFEFAVSAVRSIGGRVDLHNKLIQRIASMGQPLYRCQPPTGYRDFADAWVNGGALVERIQFGLTLGRMKIEGVEFNRSLLEPLSDVRDPEELLSRINGLFFHETLSPATRNVVLAELKKEDGRMPDGEMRRPDLPQVAGLLFGSPEFQRR